MTGTARLAAISLDCADPVALAEFSTAMLDRVLIDPARHPFCITNLVPDL
jgi:hypothetical protein